MSQTFSVLLPTRNGGQFLENCIRSILDQADEGVELIVSDNANTDETPNVLARYREHPLVKVVRLNESVSVTDNWNNALRHASKDYVLMMGDDDCLMPGYFSYMRKLLSRHGNPDCVLYNGLSYVAPGSIGDDPRSYYSESHFRFGEDFQRELVMSSEQRTSIVCDMFRFRVRIPLNMQTTLVRRAAGDLVPGGMFQAPFPDHFALNSLLLNAGKWVFSPERLVVVGVSPKSFGHYVYSNQQGSGLAYLGINATFPGRLPGNELLNGMHIWLDRLKAEFPDKLQSVGVDRNGYVRRQIYAWLMQLRLGAIDRSEIFRRFALLSAADWFGMAATAFDGESWRRLWRMIGAGKRSDAEQQWHALKPLADVNNIAQFVQWQISRAGQSVAT